jgi:hypothetical protein
MQNLSIFRPLIALLSLWLAAGSTGWCVDFTEIARFDISGTSINTTTPTPDDDIGVNAVALAWNGTKLYLAGFNNSGSFGETSIIEITNATATGLVAPTYSAKFSTDTFTPGGRGFTGLDISPDGTKLAAAFDDGLAGTPLGIQAFDTMTNTQLWAKANRGGSGVEFDPGYPGGNPALGTGVAYVGSFGSGRRALQDTTTGADIWTTSNGMIWIPTAGVTNNFTRDIAFDPDAGDMYVRSRNDLFKAERNGDNSTNQANNVLLVDLVDGPFVNYQHLGFMDTTNDGKLLIFNDRSSAAAGQDFFTVTKLSNTAGAAQTANFSFLPNPDTTPFTPATGAGWYDYDFDATSQTLAILDTSNRYVHVFQLGAVAVDDADFNDDSSVNGLDFLIWQRGFGTGTSNATGDANGDSVVNAADLVIWQNQYAGAPLVAGVAAVPEPHAIVILLFCSLGIAVRRP